jgi:hypothetical protein
MVYARLARQIALLSLTAVLAFGEDPAVPSISGVNHPGVQPTLVIGFLGGHVKPGNRVHSIVQLAERLRQQYPVGVSVAVFENHQPDKAYAEIVHWLDVDHDGSLSDEEKQNARIILYGHSWGASETVELARQLEKVKVPVLLTIQVDSVRKIGENDTVIPSNVEQAVNFYQPNGLVHGRAEIRAADPDRTEVMGNFRFNYSGSSLRCEGYPWFNRLLIKPHVQIECDPEVWNQVEALIRSRLSATGKIALERKNLPALASQDTFR